jgi:hypothetical protein
MAVGCPFITCAVKRKQIEFCWDCDENENCAKWHRHRQASRAHDSFVCYQKLEANIACVQRDGIKSFAQTQRIREKLLREMLQEFNDGRSKTYYSIAATVMDTEELKTAIALATRKSAGLGIKEKAQVLHSLLDELAKSKHYLLKLRK